MLGAQLISFILSQFFGLYLLIIGVIMFVRVRQYRQLLDTSDPNSPVILLGGLIGLLLGLFFVGIHNVWVLKPTLFITLMCWFLLCQSILWLASPDRMLSWTRYACSGSGYYFSALFMVIIGLSYLGRGVYVFATHHHRFFFLPTQG